MIKIEFHHTIPISLGGEDINENGFYISKENHDLLHEKQNLPYKEIRNFRKKANSILVPNDYLFELKANLWKAFFSNVKVEEKDQLYSLNRILNKYKEMNNINENKTYITDFNSVIDEIIEQQKILVFNILKLGK